MRLVRQMTEQLKKGKDIEGNMDKKECNDEMESFIDFITKAL